MKNFDIDFETYNRMSNAKKNFKFLEEYVLIPNGFIKLYDENSEYIAFQPEFNILFYLNNIYNYSYEKYCYFQPYQYGIRESRKYENCSKTKEEFPVFNKEVYLNITTILNGFENYGYEASLRRISKFPLLMDAIGEENRQQVYNLIGYSAEQDSALDNRKNIVCKTKTLRRK